MIVDRYHFSLSKMRPNMLLTVAHSNYGNRTKWACAKLNLVPRAHVSSGQCLGADQMTRGLWERDYAKVSMWTSMWTSMRVENPFVYVLHTTIKFEMEYFLRRANVGKKSWRSIYEKTAMERAGWQNNDFSRRCKLKCACMTANLNIIDLVEFYGCLCSLYYWKHFTEQFKGTLGS